MSKAYPSNLTLVQNEFLSQIIPQLKPSIRKYEQVNKVHTLRL